MTIYSEQTKTCFVISPIGAVGTEFRSHADSTFNTVIAPSVGELGFAAVRGDQIARPGVITNQVVDLLLNSHLVVADLTFANPNVFYELAVRHVVAKPVVSMIRADQTVPYDTAPLRTIRFDLATPAAIHAAKAELRAHIGSALAPGGDSSNPISSALGPWQLRAWDRGVTRQAVEAVMGWYLELRVLLSFRRRDERACRLCDAAARAVGRIHTVFDEAAQSMGLAPPDTSYELERHTFMAARGMESEEDYWTRE